MAFNVELPAILNASSGLLFAALGVFCLAVSRGARRPLLLGLLALGYGANFVVTNLWPADERWPLAPLAVHALADAVVAVAGVALAVEVARGAPPSRRRALAALAVAIGALFAFAILHFLPRAERYVGLTAIVTTTPEAATVFFLASTGLFFATAVLVASCALAYGSAPARERRGLASLAACFGAWPMFYLPILVIGESASGNAFFLSALVLASCSWLVALADEDARPARRTLFGLLSLGLLGATLGAFFGLSGGKDHGTPGVLRTALVALLAVAIFRHELLGVPLPRIVRTRGALGAGALAVLFIVAQVAQEFLSAQYGLLMGGAVAGAFLFAAHPIQRTMERWSAPSEARSVEVRASDEEIYRAALRLALRDRRLTRAEELDLHRLATRLGIPGERAHELLIEVEREAGLA